MTNANDPIDVVITSTKWNTAHKGLTKREYFSAMALQGVLSDTSKASIDSEFVSCLAVEYADALINALNEKNG